MWAAAKSPLGGLTLKIPNSVGHDKKILITFTFLYVLYIKKVPDDLEETQ